MTEPKMIRLKSGMRLVTVDMPGLRSVTVLAMVGVGSRYEDQPQAGISHFLEHLPFKGTKNYPTSMDLAVAIDGVGGKHNAFTGKEYTGYWVKVGASKLNLALDVVSDLVQTARLRDEDIDKERGVIIEEINMYEDQPQAKVGDVFEELVYQGSPLARSVIGTKETVGNLKQKDFLAHLDKWYDPGHTILGIVGNVQMTNDKLQMLVENYFSKGEKRAGSGVSEINNKSQMINSQQKPRIKVEYKKTEQAHFHLGFPGMSRYDKDRYALSLLSTLTGGNSSSRLFNEIREKRGLAYYAYALADMNRDLGSFYAFEGVNLNQAKEAIKVTVEEFAKLSEAKIDTIEVNRAKEYVIGKLDLDLEDSSRMAELMVSRVLYEGEAVSVAEIVAGYKQVSVEQVRAVAKRLIDMKKLNLAIIGPYKVSEFDFLS